MSIHRNDNSRKRLLVEDSQSGEIGRRRSEYSRSHDDLQCILTFTIERRQTANQWNLMALVRPRGRRSVDEVVSDVCGQTC